MSKVRRTRLWRWRSNPLRRHADVVEAWIVLASWTGFALGGAVVGTVTARAADESLSQARAKRHSVEAVLVESTASSVTDTEGASDSAVWAKVRWTGSDRSIHTGRTMVDAGHKAGATVLVWTDRKGNLTKEPATATEAAVETGLVGTVAALAVGGLTLGAGRIARWRLDRKRIGQWGREWKQVGPQWQRNTT
ncbi:Rv1733c family protein [Streptomyces umbrinus]|uniref:Rv1733c family protein n=1 Tax=Streptomyces umbrinus TaxID=67370 RepID=UPI00340001BB